MSVTRSQLVNDSSRGPLSPGLHNRQFPHHFQLDPSTIACGVDANLSIAEEAAARTCNVPPSTGDVILRNPSRIQVYRLSVATQTSIQRHLAL